MNTGGAHKLFQQVAARGEADGLTGRLTNRETLTD